MALPTETRRRAGTRAVLLTEFQTAYRSPVTDLSSARNIWCASIINDFGILKAEDQWMTTNFLPDEADRINKVELPTGQFTCLASADVIEYLLRSNWGVRAGDGTYTQDGQPSEFVTLGYVEDRTFRAGGELIRFSDVWFHRLELFILPNSGVLRANVDWAASVRHDPQDLSLSATQAVLPASPMAPEDSRRFPVRNVQIVRDPDGANERFSARDIRLEINQRFHHKFEMTDGVDLSKAGQPTIFLEFETRMNDESFASFDRSFAATKQPWRFLASSPGSAARLQVDFASMEFQVSEVGRDGKNVRRVRFTGTAFLDSSGSGVDITLIKS